MYESLKQSFSARFGKKPRWIISAPGRTELSGNHTDHQHGRVLAAAVNLQTTAAVAPNDGKRIRVFSEGYELCDIPLPVGPAERAGFGTTASLIRGVAAWFEEHGHEIRGFDAYVVSEVLPGSGLSSSAAFEVLMATILNRVASCALTPTELAIAGRYAENVYFGKPCGLMDQLASSVGNVIAIDFADSAKPDIRRIAFDFASSGYALCIIDSGADHSDLTDSYAAITEEMGAVSAYFGAEVLREVSEEEFYRELPGVRRAAGDRAVLRAIHFFEENRRVAVQADALEQGNFETFLKIASASGRSSWMLLQNVIPEGHAFKQEVAFALALSERLLGGRGAVRIHGGGFAGTIQAFVPREILNHFRSETEKVLGAGSCHVLSIRSEGAGVSEECE